MPTRRPFLIAALLLGLASPALAQPMPPLPDFIKQAGGAARRSALRPAALRLPQPDRRLRRR